MLCFQQCTGVPDGIMECVGKKAYSEKLNQKGRNTEQLRDERGVETGDRRDLHLEDDIRWQTWGIFYYLLWLNCVSKFSCNDSYINQGRKVSATNQSLTIFSVSNTEKKKKKKKPVVLLRVSNRAFFKR